MQHVYAPCFSSCLCVSCLLESLSWPPSMGIVFRMHMTNNLFPSKLLLVLVYFTAMRAKQDTG